MGKSLYNEYERLLSSGSWKYYPLKETLGIKMFSDRDSMISFFKHYLGKGEKANMPIIDFIDNLSMDRLQHTLSCFLLGVLFYQRSGVIASGINDELNRIPINNPETVDERFYYLWMLISIFHDFGYAIENKDVALNKIELEKLIANLRNRPKTIPSIYTKKLLKNYAKYHVCRFGSDDHGICGGIKLYAELCELRKEKENHLTTECYWGEDLIPSYALAAWTIACHNIWMIEDCEKNIDTITCYKHLDLSKLIYKTQSRIIKGAPCLFLLCLVDSIDPIKIFKDLDILNHITFDFSIAGCIDIHTDGLCQPKKNQYLYIIKGLYDWLTDVNDTTITL